MTSRRRALIGSNCPMRLCQNHGKAGWGNGLPASPPHLHCKIRTEDRQTQAAVGRPARSLSLSFCPIAVYLSRAHLSAFWIFVRLLCRPPSPPLPLAAVRRVRPVLQQCIALPDILFGEFAAAVRVRIAPAGRENARTKKIRAEREREQDNRRRFKMSLLLHVASCVNAKRGSEGE